VPGDDDATDDDFASLFGSPGRRKKGPDLAPPPPAKIPRPGERRGAEESDRGGFRWPDPDEPRLGAASGLRDADLASLRRGEPEPEERIDLHGLRREAAGATLARLVESARARGLRCVVVVHGRGRHSEGGEAVLRDALPGWLSQPPCKRHVLAFAPAPPRLGGNGATLVLLKRDRTS